MKLKLITPERIVLEREVDMVQASGSAGEFAVLPGHEPLVASLGFGILTFSSGGEEDFAAVLGGLLEVRGDEVTVLSDVAELGHEIDEARASQAKERAEAEKTQKTDKLDVYISEMSIGKAITRLKAAELSRTKRRRGQ